MHSFIDELLRFPRTKSIVCNFLDAKELSLIPDPTINSFFSWWLSTFTSINTSLSPIPGTEEALLESLTAVLMSSARWDDWCNNRPHSEAKALLKLGRKPEFSSKCHPTAVNEQKMLLSRTVTLEDIFQYLSVDLRIESFGNLSIDCSMQGRRLTTTGGFTLSISADQLRAGTSLGNPGQPVWYAPKKITKNYAYTQNADRLRDLLGLHHIENNQNIVTFFFKFSSKKICHRWRPTILDAGIHARFKTLPDGSRAKSRTSWGCTIDLKKCKEQNKILDGSQERVCESITTDDIVLDELCFSGRTSSYQPGNSTSDKWFADKLSRGKNNKKLKKEILKLL